MDQKRVYQNEDIRSTPHYHGYLIPRRGRKGWRLNTTPPILLERDMDPAELRRMLGYEMRAGYPSELNYFAANPHVGGMASEDNRIVLNPYANLTDQGMDSVAANEALRLYMRKRGIYPGFSLTPSQQGQFAGTPYETNLPAARQSIVGRILSNDPSALDYTPEQRLYSDRLLQEILEQYRR
jgi:hypothetical protein